MKLALVGNAPASLIFLLCYRTQSSRVTQTSLCEGYVENSQDTNATDGGPRCKCPEGSALTGNKSTCYGRQFDPKDISSDAKGHCRCEALVSKKPPHGPFDIAIIAGYEDCWDILSYDQNDTAHLEELQRRKLQPRVDLDLADVQFKLLDFLASYHMVDSLSPRRYVLSRVVLYSGSIQKLSKYDQSIPNARGPFRFFEDVAETMGMFLNKALLPDSDDDAKYGKSWGTWTGASVPGNENVAKASDPLATKIELVTNALEHIQAQQEKIKVYFFDANKAHLDAVRSRVEELLEKKLLPGGQGVPWTFHTVFFNWATSWQTAGKPMCKKAKQHKTDWFGCSK